MRAPSERPLHPNPPSRIETHHGCVSRAKGSRRRDRSLPNGLKLSRKAPFINALDQITQDQAKPGSFRRSMSRQRLWGLVGSNFELESLVLFVRH
jgi:hypothetical protein